MIPVRTGYVVSDLFISITALMQNFYQILPEMIINFKYGSGKKYLENEQTRKWFLKTIKCQKDLPEATVTNTYIFVGLYNVEKLMQLIRKLHKYSIFVKFNATHPTKLP